MSKRKKILLVDDDTDLRENLAEILRTGGFVVTEAGDGDAGKFLTLLSEFDLIISDVMMPKVEGQEMIEFIKKKCSVPVLMISGLPLEEVEKKLTSARPNAILKKPFPTPVFLDTVKKLLKK